MLDEIQLLDYEADLGNGAVEPFFLDVAESGCANFGFEATAKLVKTKQTETFAKLTKLVNEQEDLIAHNETRRTRIKSIKLEIERKTTLLKQEMTDLFRPVDPDYEFFIMDNDFRNPRELKSMYADTSLTKFTAQSLGECVDDLDELEMEKIARLRKEVGEQLLLLQSESEEKPGKKKKRNS